MERLTTVRKRFEVLHDVDGGKWSGYHVMLFITCRCAQSTWLGGIDTMQRISIDTIHQGKS